MPKLGDVVGSAGGAGGVGVGVAVFPVVADVEEPLPPHPVIAKAQIRNPDARRRHARKDDRTVWECSRRFLRNP